MKTNLAVLLVVAILTRSEGFADAQQTARISRIGLLISPSASFISFRLAAFRQRLRELGYVEGKNIVIEYRYAEGRLDRLPDLAAELVGLKVDVIVTVGPASSAAMKATRTIPIITTGSSDPVGDGLASSLAQSGNNLTGLSVVSFDLAGKRLELLRDTFPKISRVAVLLDADAPVHRRQFADMEKVAQALSVRLQALELRGSKLDFDSVFQRAISQRANALLTLPNPFVSRHRTRVLEFAAKNRLPAIYPRSNSADAGGLMSYGPDYRDLNRRAAYFVDRILKGAKPSELPVEQPTKFELVINLKTAKELGLTIPPDVLMWADKVIQ